MSENPKLNENGVNNATAATPTPSKETKSLTDLYSKTYTEVFNKLTKAEQDRILKDLQKPAEVIRGKEVQYPEVSKFLKEVCRKAEGEYDKQFVKQEPKK